MNNRFELIQIKYIVTRNNGKEILCRLSQNKYFLPINQIGNYQSRQYCSVKSAMSFLRKAGFDIDDTYNFIQVCTHINALQTVDVV